MSDVSTPTRNRTERAILEAAVSVLARDRAATLPQIAQAAGVGRTTLHRYFPDREGLMVAAAEHALEAMDEVTVAARLDQGTPQEAMRRAVAALASVSDQIMFVFGDKCMLTEILPKAAPNLSTDQDPVIMLIRRGQQEGVFDAEASAEWIQQMLWATCFTAFEQVQGGAMAKFDVVPTVVRTLERGISAG
ncbi:TetR/AcrR family transcriptional regulator [Kineosporia rhizophila]|uniref:TetR/AcrR family transcriptional regulator n=1 Tax=Kineosporia TaxID=49184 RepID=UPI001E58B072|nr:TetR/AcrR family transcriptional regulator [Kineosporia sp. NBRC 101677]MCE0539331.1 TetR/AcrR family transcriptional regulator [Kineosporia rhizophila]